MTDFSCMACDRRKIPEGVKHPNGWLCMRFKRKETNPVTGLPEPPYWECRAVRKIAEINGVCEFYTPKPPEKEMVVKESIGGKSVAFKEKIHAD